MSKIDGKYLRSNDIESSIARAFMQGAGFKEEDMRKKPVIGICNSWSELNPCNMNLQHIAQYVKKGIEEAGGIPVEFPTISIHEQINNPSSLLLRNLMTMDVEEMINRSPIDGVVLLNGCDKTVPAQLMGAISAGKPMISVPAGPRGTSMCGGKPLTIHSLWEQKEKRQKDEINDHDWDAYMSKLIPTPGTCNVMGTASTMAAIVEALGLSIPGTAFYETMSNEREEASIATGRLAVEMVRENRTPDQFVTLKSLENAYRVVSALGGSTNGIIHLEAIAGRVGLHLGIERLKEWSETTPHLVAVSPSGAYSLQDFIEVGGIPALMKHLQSFIHQDSAVITGEKWNDVLADIEIKASPVLHTVEQPINEDGGIAILKGSLAPTGAVFKRSAVPEKYWIHRGPALVFDGMEEMNAKINDPALPVDENSVIILRGIGPVGAPGMPETAKVPIPKKLWEQGVTNMVRISDGRMSGTADGAVVLHVTPEAAVGGPIAFVENGDLIELDAVKGLLNVCISEEQLRERKASFVKKQGAKRGYEWLYHQHVMQADKGADFDFLTKNGREN